MERISKYSFAMEISSICLIGNINDDAYLEVNFDELYEGVGTYPERMPLEIL